MTWTTRHPTKEGWYWVRAHTELSNEIKTFIVHAYKMYKSSNEPDTVFWDGVNAPVTSDRFTEWGSEPIPEPGTEADLAQRVADVEASMDIHRLAMNRMLLRIDALEEKKG